MEALKLRGVRKKFGPLEVLKGISLDLEEGDFLVLLGPSGCGKSTLLALIAGLEEITAGEIHIGDTIANDLHPRDRNIAMVFQSYALYPSMTVRANMAFGLKMRGVNTTAQNEAVERVANLLDIGHLLERKPGQLSGGQRQRVAMGRALVRNPMLFLFDEPLSNLDAKLRVQMRSEIKKLHNRLQTTVVYVTHDQVEAMTLATKIAVMQAGEIQQYAAPEEIYNRPANTFVAGFVGSPQMNFLPGKLERGRGEPRVSIEPTNGASECTIPIGGIVGRNLADGDEVIVGIRPESIRPAGRSSAFTFDAAIELVEMTGADTLATFGLGGHEMMARLPAEEKPALGDRIGLSFDPAHLHLFDRRSSVRVN